MTDDAEQPVQAVVSLPNPPSPLGAFIKTVFSPNSGPLWPWLNLYDYFHAMSGSGGSTWRRFRTRCITAGGTESADDAYFDIDVVNYTNGAVDDTWTSTDFNSVIFQLDKILQAWLPYMSPSKVFDSIHAYRMAFNPDYVVGQPGSSPFLHSGPPEFIAPVNLTGAGTGPVQASQVALSVTHKVPARRHWGRFYMPFPDANTVAGDLQFSTGPVDAIANAVHAAYVALADAELYPVVVQTQDAKKASPALHQIVEVQVDSNPDVIRRRRAHTTRYRKVTGAAALEATPQQPVA